MKRKSCARFSRLTTVLLLLAIAGSLLLGTPLGVGASALTIDGRVDGGYRQVTDNGDTTIHLPTMSGDVWLVAAQAALSVNLDQCANIPSPCSWQNGDLNGQNSAYAEGDVVPFRLAIEGLTPGSHTIHINYDFTAGGHKAYDFLATYNATENVDLCASGGGGVSSLCPSLPAANTSPFPSDPFAANGLSVAGAEAEAGVSRNLTLFGGTITNIAVATHSGDVDRNSTADTVVTFTSTGSAVLIAWGGHLARSTYWNVDGSGEITGAPWHMRTQQLDDSANRNQDRSIQPSALPDAPPTPTNTPLPPTATPTNTSVPPTATPTNTSVPPTATPTNTSVPPAATPTNTPIPPTATPTNTPVPPAATPTNTPVPPAATPTNTPVPPAATPTNTPVPPTATAVVAAAAVTSTPVPTATPVNSPTTVPTVVAGVVEQPPVVEVPAPEPALESAPAILPRAGGIPLDGSAGFAGLFLTAIGIGIRRLLGSIR